VSRFVYGTYHPARHLAQHLAATLPRHAPIFAPVEPVEIGVAAPALVPERPNRPKSEVLS
jgi:hypothetical protein